MKTPSVRHRTVHSLGALALVFTAGILAAGPLNPPAGPVTSTYKTLGEVEPRIAINASNTPGDADSLFKITLPGSYYLTGNITGAVGKHGIEITASGVTLDLNGFDLVGVPAMGAFDGISVTAINLTNIAVINGSVRGWGNEGVDLATFTAGNCRVEGVLARGNAGIGIATGSVSTLTNCSAFGNLGNGIITVLGSTVSNCSAFFNTGHGILTIAGCTITECIAYDNGAVGNGANGFHAGANCTFANCAASENAGIGINTGSGCTVSSCSASDNNGSGIVTAACCTVAGCSTFSNNSASGISVGAGSSVVDCTSALNAGDGIVVAANCQARGNTCDGNGLGAGIGGGVNASGLGNRIEGNTCTGADLGIVASVGGNIIVRNTCRANTTNWNIAAGNVCLVVQGATGGAILGNTGGVAPGSTDPNANFSY